jgi:predicted RecB family nuclease
VHIDGLPGLKIEQASRLRDVGVRSARQLLRASRSATGLLALAKATGVPLEALREAVQQVKLFQVRGIGPAHLEHLLAAGLETLKDLACQEPEALRRQLCRVMSHPPNLAILESWILQARQRTGEWRSQDSLPGDCLD